MSQIIAAHVQVQQQVETLRLALQAAGFTPEAISDFYVNPPGQHDLTPIGGDRDDSPGAREAPAGIVEGIAAGGVLGAALGVTTIGATGPLGPVVGALVGAHVGSLYSFAKLKEAGESERGDDGVQEAVPTPRRAGLLLAVAASKPGQAQRVAAILRAGGASDIEHAEGHIVDGDWVDFDPLSVPILLE